MTDAAGTRSYTYNEFDELVSESLTVDGVTHAKAPDGCKGDWTTAPLLPRRGEGAMGCARVNRKTAQEDAEEATNYDANALNQYTAIGDFTPQFDADGKAADGCKADWTHAQRAPRRGESAMGRARINQTKVQTSTGIWSVTYSYTPYGAVTAEGTVLQSIQWSSEFYDDELGLVYYNYRHYSSCDGRWIGRDPQDTKGLLHVYSYVENSAAKDTDVLGKDRYITHFDPIGQKGDNAIHVSIAVDKWEKNDNTCKYEKLGTRRFDFRPAVFKHSDNLFKSLLELVNMPFAAIVAFGRVIPDGYINHKNKINRPILRKTSPCQDIKVHNMIIEDMRSNMVYSLLLRNCVNWSRVAFEYGMEQPGLGECRNPDNTIFHE